MLSLICITNLMPCATQERLKPPPRSTRKLSRNLKPYAKAWGSPRLSEAQRLTANNYVGTARGRALTPKSMGSYCAARQWREGDDKGGRGLCGEPICAEKVGRIILKTSCILEGKPLKILIVWHLKPRYGISAKMGRSSRHGWTK